MPITITPSPEIPDLLIIDPKVFGDDRGWFYESFNQKEFSEKKDDENDIEMVSLEPNI